MNTSTSIGRDIRATLAKSTKEATSKFKAGLKTLFWNKLEKLEEEASAAETESKESSSIGRSTTPHGGVHWQRFKHMGWVKGARTERNRQVSQVVKIDGYDEAKHYAV